MKKILIIQPAFIGDVILSTAVAEKLHQCYPKAAISYLVRKGNESLFEEHPFIQRIFIWNKQRNKYTHLFQLIRTLRKENFDLCVNLHRFSSSGFISLFLKANIVAGFKKNPLSFFFDYKAPHEFSSHMHETDRNHLVIKPYTDSTKGKVKLYPSKTQIDQITPFTKTPYITISPSSVWPTKQLPITQWISFCDSISTENTPVFLLGAPSDKALCEKIKSASTHKNITNLAGELTLLASAALMSKALNNYVNDSAPLHLCSAMNAVTTAVFCSTSPTFGFGPLSSTARIVESTYPLPCKPCGIHGKKACPKGHFQCGTTITTAQLLQT